MDGLLIFMAASVRLIILDLRPIIFWNSPKVHLATLFTVAEVTE